MKSREPASVGVLQWVFQRDQEFITCEIDADGTRGYDVCVVPHWDVSAGVIERFDALRHAFQRHAEVAHRLREAGWVRAGTRRLGHTASASL